MDDAEIEGAIQGAVSNAINASIPPLVERIVRKAPGTLRRRRRHVRGFERRLRKRWGAALDLYELTLVCCQEWGAEFNERQRSQAAAEQDHAFEALTRLHARACLTASEILALLETGHAVGAEARWRTLHEITVVAQVIGQQAEGIAERYLEHESIESAKDAEEYELFRERLGYEPFDPAGLAMLRQRRSALLTKYGRPFERNYGWAAPLFGGKPPEFSQLDALVGLDHLRPFRTLGTRRVHASSHGTALGVLRRGPNRMLQAGPTNYGLADSGHGSLISLAQATITLFVEGRPGVDDPSWTVRSGALSELVDKAGDAFLAAHTKLSEDERRVWSSGDAS